MIVTPDDKASKRLSDSKEKPHSDEPQVDPDEPPPSYSSQTESIASGSSSLPCDPTTFRTKPTNFLALFNENSAIKGEFVIDPSIRIPSSILPPLSDGESEDDQKNLYLRSKNSSIHADIWLLAFPLKDSQSVGAIGADKSRRTTIALTSDHGSIRADMHVLDGAAPFSLTARAAHGAIRIALPRSFHGLLCLSTRHGSISVSDTIVQNATQLSQVGTTRRYFIGDFQELGEDEWDGDRVEVETLHGSIRIKYVDDEVPGKKGLLSRLFGR